MTRPGNRARSSWSIEGTFREESTSKHAVEDERIATEAIPSYVLTGLGESSGEFLSIIRYAMPEDGESPELLWMPGDQDGGE